MKIIGREKEQEILEQAVMNEDAEFIALYGRRRIGKTYLISNFFEGKGVFFELTGRSQASKANQLKNFSTVLANTFNRGERDRRPTDWDEALMQLYTAIKSVEESKKVILFFDELPWLASAKSGFLEALDLFWNRYISRRKNVILVICGSAASWMIKKIINNKAGLHNRLTRPPIHLKPFTLGETKKYLDSKKIYLEHKQIVDIYMSLGGVAHYLSLIPRGKSSAEITAELCFCEGAPLESEFHRLYNSLFNQPEKHIEVVKALAKNHQGLTQQQLFHPHTSLAVGGGSVNILQELESCGFILKVPQFGKKKKDAQYRLIDAFSLFYLKWMENSKAMGSSYWLQKQSSQKYSVWCGYAFENVCLQHIGQIIKALELTVTAQSYSTWKYEGDAGGAQIDLVIDRSDKCINLCEIKFYEGDFKVSKDYAKKLLFKKSCFRERTLSKKTLFTTMISSYGVHKNSHYFEAVDQQITMESLFL